MTWKTRIPRRDARGTQNFGGLGKTSPWHAVFVTSAVSSTGDYDINRHHLKSDTDFPSRFLPRSIRCEEREVQPGEGKNWRSKLGCRLSPENAAKRGNIITDTNGKGRKRELSAFAAGRKITSVYPLSSLFFWRGITREKGFWQAIGHYRIVGRSLRY